MTSPAAHKGDATSAIALNQQLYWIKSVSYPNIVFNLYTHRDYAEGYIELAANIVNYYQQNGTQTKFTCKFSSEIDKVE